MAKIDNFIGTEITTRFGNVLTVSWEGDRDKGCNKLYSVECDRCEGVFKGRKGDLVRGHVPCDCNPRNVTRRDDSDFVGSTRTLENGAILKVLPWEGDRQGSNKIYPIACSKCDLDTELFPDGFTSPKRDFLKNQIPCGCSSKPQWSKDQYKILILRECKKRGNVKLKGRGEWKTHKTKLKLECPEHGEWASADIHNFLNGGTGCPSCAEHGFDPSKPATLYLTDLFHIDTFIADKFGITNREVETRMNEHSRESEYKHGLIHSVSHTNGQLILDLENHIKGLVTTSYLSKEQLPDGYTETTSTSNRKLILDLMNEFEEQHTIEE